MGSSTDNTMKYIHTWIYFISMVFLIIGAVYCLFMGVFKINLMNKIPSQTLVRILYTIIGAAGLYVFFRRDFYLPFLGETIAPCVTLKDFVPPGASEEVRVTVSPGAKVLYWGSEPSTAAKMGKTNDWSRAYAGFENAGVTTANMDGIAVLRLRSPQPYTVPWKGRIESHVHYRECGSMGMLGAVKTVYLNKNAVEGSISGPAALEGFENQSSEPIYTNISTACPTCMN